jgi:hypothetical protein
MGPFNEHKSTTALAHHDRGQLTIFQHALCDFINNRRVESFSAFCRDINFFDL